MRSFFYYSTCKNQSSAFTFRPGICFFRLGAKQIGCNPGTRLLSDDDINVFFL